MNIPDYDQAPVSAIERHMRDLHAAREAAAEAEAALNEFDADDDEIIGLRQLIADAQRRLETRLTTSDKRKELQSAFDIAKIKVEAQEKVFAELALEHYRQHPDELVLGVKAFEVEEAVIVVDEDKALKLVMEKLWGIPNLLTINQDVLLKMHQNGLLKPEWRRAQHKPLDYVFGSSVPYHAESWYSVVGKVKPVIEADFTTLLAKLDPAKTTSINGIAITAIRVQQVEESDICPARERTDLTCIEELASTLNEWAMTVPHDDAFKTYFQIEFATGLSIGDKTILCAPIYETARFVKWAETVLAREINQSEDKSA